MEIKKVVELLQALETRDPKADVIFDNYKNYDEFLPGYTYDLNSISIRSKDSKLVIGLGFDKRSDNNSKSHCRMKNMGTTLNLKPEGANNV